MKTLLLSQAQRLVCCHKKSRTGGQSFLNFVNRLSESVFLQVIFTVPVSAGEEAVEAASYFSRVITKIKQL